jgi:hypothetical protein
MTSRSRPTPRSHLLRRLRHPWCSPAFGSAFHRQQLWRPVNPAKEPAPTFYSKTTWTGGPPGRPTDEAQRDLNNLQPKLYASDNVSGRLLAEILLPANAGGAPMTYIADGKQYVVFSIGGATIPEEVIALALP